MNTLQKITAATAALSLALGVYQVSKAQGGVNNLLVEQCATRDWPEFQEEYMVKFCHAKGMIVVPYAG